MFCYARLLRPALLSRSRSQQQRKRTSATAGPDSAALTKLVFPVALVIEDVYVAGRKLRIVKPGDENELLDLYVSLNQLDADPYWAAIWPSSLALAEFIFNNPSAVLGKRVLDVGCGLGVAGIAAGLAGAREVLLTDREPRALFCSLLSAAANGLPVRAPPNLPESALPPLAAALAALRLPPPLPAAAPGAPAPGVRAMELDWSAPQPLLPHAPFDAVLACDVLYEASAAGPIARLLREVAGGDGRRPLEALLADPAGRTPANRARFLELARGEGAGALEQVSKATVMVQGAGSGADGLVGGAVGSAAEVVVERLRREAQPARQ